MEWERIQLIERPRATRDGTPLRLGASVRYQFVNDGGPAEARRRRVALLRGLAERAFEESLARRSEQDVFSRRGNLQKWLARMLRPGARAVGCEILSFDVQDHNPASESESRTKALSTEVIRDYLIIR